MFDSDLHEITEINRISPSEGRARLNGGHLPYVARMDGQAVGLDPEERVRFRNFLSDLSVERIVVISIHIVSDMEATATYIALVNKGQLLRKAAPEN